MGTRRDLEELLLGARGNTRDALNRLAAGLIEQAQAMSHDEDLAAEAAEIAFFKRANFQPRGPGSIRNWLGRIMFNLRRRRNAFRRHSEILRRRSAPTLTATGDCRREIFNVLPTREKLVLLGTAEGFNDREVAELLGLAPASVRVYRHRAIRRLKTRLARPHGEPADAAGSQHA